MTKWEYKILDCEWCQGRWRVRYEGGNEISDWKNGGDEEDYINRLGNQGWELVNLATSAALDGNYRVHNHTFALKRPKP